MSSLASLSSHLRFDMDVNWLEISVRRLLAVVSGMQWEWCLVSFWCARWAAVRSDSALAMVSSRLLDSLEISSDFSWNFVLCLGNVVFMLHVEGLDFGSEFHHKLALVCCVGFHFCSMFLC